MICVTFSKPTVEPFLLKHPEVKMIELRLDLMEIDETTLQHFLSLPVETIVTCRPTGKITENQRLTLLLQAISLGARYVDVEIESEADFIATIKKSTIKHNCKLIVSYHNFEKTPKPSELEKIVENCRTAQANIIKIACMVNDERDILNIKALYKKNKSLIAIGMGEKGTITRIKACEWSAPFTYAAAEPDMRTAQTGIVDYKSFKNTT